MLNFVLNDLHAHILTAVYHCKEVFCMQQLYWHVTVWFVSKRVLENSTTPVHGNFYSFLFSFLWYFYFIVYFWGCHIFRGALTCGRSSVSPGCAAHARCPRPATCIWPRSSVWIPTGLQSQPPPLKPSPTLKKAPPIKSWSTPSTPTAPVYSNLILGDMHTV